MSQMFAQLIAQLSIRTLELKVTRRSHGSRTSRSRTARRSPQGQLARGVFGSLREHPAGGGRNSCDLQRLLRRGQRHRDRADSETEGQFLTKPAGLEGPLLLADRGIRTRRTSKPFPDTAAVSSFGSAGATIPGSVLPGSTASVHATQADQIGALHRAEHQPPHGARRGIERGKKVLRFRNRGVASKQCDHL